MIVCSLVTLKLSTVSQKITQAAFWSWMFPALSTFDAGKLDYALCKGTPRNTVWNIVAHCNGQFRGGGISLVMLRVEICRSGGSRSGESKIAVTASLHPNTLAHQAKEIGHANSSCISDICWKVGTRVASCEEVEVDFATSWSEHQSSDSTYLVSWTSTTYLLSKLMRDEDSG